VTEDVSGVGRIDLDVLLLSRGVLSRLDSSRGNFCSCTLY
jgi:hypothetical protein